MQCPCRIKLKIKLCLWNVSLPVIEHMRTERARVARFPCTLFAGRCCVICLCTRAVPFFSVSSHALSHRNIWKCKQANHAGLLFDEHSPVLLGRNFQFTVLCVHWGICNWSWSVLHCTLLIHLNLKYQPFNVTVPSLHRKTNVLLETVSHHIPPLT